MDSWQTHWIGSHRGRGVIQIDRSVLKAPESDNGRAIGPLRFVPVIPRSWASIVKQTKPTIPIGTGSPATRQRIIIDDNPTLPLASLYIAPRSFDEGVRPFLAVKLVDSDPRAFSKLELTSRSARSASLHAV